DAFPTPGVHLEFDDRKRLGLRIGIHAWFSAITAELSANDIVRCERWNGLQNFGLFIANRLTVVPRRRFHAKVSEHLEHVILNHVPHRSSRIIECATTLNSEVLSHGDLHALDVGTVPKRFHEGVRKPEDQHVVNRTLPKVVINPEHLRFVESAEYD